VTPPSLETASEGHQVRCLRWRDLELAPEGTT